MRKLLRFLKKIFSFKKKEKKVCGKISCCDVKGETFGMDSCYISGKYCSECYKMIKED